MRCTHTLRLDNMTRQIHTALTHSHTSVSDRSCTEHRMRDADNTEEHPSKRTSTQRRSMRPCPAGEPPSCPWQAPQLPHAPQRPRAYAPIHPLMGVYGRRAGSAWAPTPPIGPQAVGNDMHHIDTNKIFPCGRLFPPTDRLKI